MFRSISLRAAWSAVLIVGGATAASAADRPAQYALPDDTLFVVRLPAAAKFFETIGARTKLGRVLTDAARVAEFQKFLRDEAGEDLDMLEAGLGRLGLSYDDLRQSLDGEWGYAGVLLPNVDDAPELRGVLAYAGLAWSEAGDALIDKWFAALDRKLQDQPAGPGAIRRQDSDLAGTKVVHLIVPMLAYEGGTVKLGPFGEDEAAKPAPNVDPKNAAKPPLEVGQVHLLLARGDGRLTLAHTFTAGPAGDAAEAPQAAAAAAAGLESLRQTLARFLAAAAGSDESIVRRWEQTPGLAESLPDGEPLVEALVNLPRLVALLNRPGNEDGWKIVQAAGLEKLGPLAYRTAFDGTVLRSGLFVSAPAPRPGLLALFDQATIKPEPADWVAKTAVGYQQVSFDFGKAYQTVAQMLRESSPRGEGALTALENQSQTFLQIDPQTLLTSLGKTHTILTYLPALTDEDDPRRANRDDAAAQTAVAFVWSPSDEAVWRKLMQMLSAAAAQPIVTEQGFSGIRYQEQTMQASWFIGNGYMTVAIGSGVTEKVLANLRSTPRTDESLRRTDYAQRAAELLPAEPVLSYDLTDGAGLLRFADTVMQRAFADVSDTMAARLKKLWPAADEWEGSVGVSASTLSANGHGVMYRSVLDLPAP